MIIPGSVFERLKNGYAVYWRFEDRSYFAYVNRRGDVVVHECDSAEVLKSIIKTIDEVPAIGLCILTEGGVRCIRSDRGLTGREIVNYLNSTRG